MVRVRGYLRVTHDDQRLGDHQPDGAALTGLRNIHSFQRCVIADDIRRVAVCGTCQVISPCPD